MARVRAGRINPVALQPAAQAVDTYTRPAAPAAPMAPQESALTQLGAALQGMTPSLEAYLDREHDEMLEREDQRAVETLSGMSLEEAREAVNNGTLAERENPYFMAAMNRNYGTRLGMAARDDALARFGGQTTDRGDPFDIENGNMDQFVAGIMEQDLNSLNGEFARAGYLSVMQDSRSQLTRSAATAQAQIARERSQDAIFTEWYADIQAGIDAGASTQEIVQGVWNSFDNNAALLGLTRDEQRDSVITLARSLADKGEYEIVRSLLMDPINDRIGAIGRSRRYAQAASDILEIAGTNLGNHMGVAYANDLRDLYRLVDRGSVTADHLQEFNAAHPNNQLDAEQAARLLDQSDRNYQDALADMGAADARTSAIMQANARERTWDEALIRGDLDLVVPRDGADVVDVSTTSGLRHVGHDEIVQSTVDRMLTRVDAGEVQFADFASYVDQAGLVSDTLARRFSTAAARAGNIALASDAESIDALIPTFELYRLLSAADRDIALDHVAGNERAEAAFEAYAIARVDMGLSEQQAMQHVYRVSQVHQDTDATRAQQASLRELQAAIRNLDASGAGFGLAASYIERIARNYVYIGLSPGEALEHALKRFDDNHAVAMGLPIRTGTRPVLELEAINGRSFTDDILPGYVQYRIEDMQLPEDVTDTGDIQLTVAGGDSGTFLAYSRETVRPLVDDATGVPLMFSMADIREFETTTYTAQVIAEQQAAAERAQVSAAIAEQAAEAPMENMAADEEHFAASQQTRFAQELRSRVREGLITIEEAQAQYYNQFGQDLASAFFDDR